MAYTKDRSGFDDFVVPDSVFNPNQRNHPSYNAKQNISLTTHDAIGNTHKPQPLSITTKSVTTDTKLYTRYDCCGNLVLFLSILTLIAEIGWIIYNIMEYGLDTAYCQSPNISSSSCPNQCYDSIQCIDASNTFSPFIAQCILILVLLYFLYQLYKSCKFGIEIYKPSKVIKQKENCCKRFIKNIESLKQRLENKRINCRRCAYKEKGTPQNTSINFIYNSLAIISLLRTLKKAPIILLNIFSGNCLLMSIAFVLIWSLISDIITTFWGAYSCCCNCCKGKCCTCCKNGCCCDCCMELLGCDCIYNYFPKHHKPYAKGVGSIMFYSTTWKYAAAISQITAVASVESVDNEYELWLLSLNFVLGVNSIVSVFKIYWRYYYLCWFYWSRMAVNKHESTKIHELLNKLLVEAYIFRIEVQDDDEFVRIQDDEQIANKVNVNCHCLTCCIGFYMCILCLSMLYALYKYTGELNIDFINNEASLGIDSVVSSFVC